MRVAMLANLVLYSVVASQPLFYMVVMTAAQRRLSAPAYIELRQHVNAIMNKRVPLIYGGAAAALVPLLVLAARAGDRVVFCTAGVALACLVADVVFMTRVALPINSVVDRWSTNEYPPDWERYRVRWFAIFACRQAVLLAGFAGLLVSAAFAR